jgi:two-component system, NarL family, sensor kinase
MDTNETKIFIALLIAACVLALIIVFFIVTIFIHKKKIVALYRQKIKAEISTLEAERKRIASDLHDDLGPLLSAVKLQVNSLDSASLTDQHTIAKASANMDSILTKIREIANDLVPNVLIRNGLIKALNSFIENINETGKMFIHADYGDITTLPPEYEIHIYRMIQEIIHNSIKHSEASICSLLFKLEQNKLKISFTDNGKGFDRERLSKTNPGFGLQNILSRTEIMEGELFIDTKPGYGVNYTIEIPIDSIHETDKPY